MDLRRTAAAAVAVMAALLHAPVTSVAAPQGASDRAEVEATFLEEVLPALDVPIGWTGDVASCDPGAPSAAAQSATLTTINFVRGLAGLDPVSFDPALSAKAQKAALIMQANDDLDHFPPSSWRCWTEEGAEAAGSSNLALGISGAAAIVGYMQDDGEGNTAAGHRRWILRPDAATMGSGSTSGANALWIFGADAPSAASPPWVPWPVAGYFPSPLEPIGRWSLSSTSGEASFANASVTVTGPGGASLPVQTYPEQSGFANNTLVWEVSGIQIPDDDAPVTYHVTVSGVTGAASPSYEYDVHLFSPPIAVEIAPALTGRTRVGRTLRVAPGEWTPDPEDLDFQWLRGGIEISDARADSYRLTRADRGKRISVQVTAERFGYADETVTTPETRAIRPRS